MLTETETKVVSKSTLNFGQDRSCVLPNSAPCLRYFGPNWPNAVQLCRCHPNSPAFDHVSAEIAKLDRTRPSWAEISPSLVDVDPSLSMSLQNWRNGSPMLPSHTWEVLRHMRSAKLPAGVCPRPMCAALLKKPGEMSAEIGPELAESGRT